MKVLNEVQGEMVKVWVQVEVKAPAIASPKQLRLNQINYVVGILDGIWN